VSLRGNLGRLVEDAELHEPVYNTGSEELERIGEGVGNVLGDIVNCPFEREYARNGGGFSAKRCPGIRSVSLKTARA
jgi:hypothetical protein